MDFIQTNTQSSALRIIRFCLILLTITMYGCTGTKYNQDYKAATSFEHLKTYSWRHASSDIAGVDGQQLQQLADIQLASQGYTHTETNPDMLLDMNLVTRISTGSSTGIGLSIGLPIGQHGSIGLGGGKSVPNDKQEGVILIDITDNLSKSLIWRGSAEGVPMQDFSLKAEDKLARVLKKLLSQFPPK